MRLNDKTAIITGASRGLGKEIAIHFVKEGASVAICSRSENDLGIAVKEIKRFMTKGQKIIADVVDVSDRSTVAAFVRNSYNELGRLDALVNNAGI